MSGLEAVEILLSKVKKESEEGRIDSEYFQKKYLTEELHIDKFPKICLGDISFITDGQHGYHIVDESSSISHITAKNTKYWFADNVDCDMLHKSIDDNNKRSSLEKDDILLSTRGSVGFCAIVTNDILPANIDQDLARIYIKKREIIKPSYLLCYFNSKYGKDWTTRNSTGMVQQGISLDKIKKMNIPVLNQKFQELINNIIDLAYKKQRELNYIYTDTENRLLSALGMENFTPSNESVSIKSFSESYGKSGRLDAEYYQKKYDEFETKLNGKTGLIKIHDNNFIPDNKTEYRYIELANIGTNGNITGVTIDIGKELPTRARRIVKKGQVIVSSIEGSLASCALITDEYDGALCSTGFYVVDSNTYNSETLLVLFKSTPIQILLKKRCSGTILTAIAKTALEEMPLPYIDEKTQKQTAADIQKSFELRKQSEQLLESAKRAVEIAIEESEEAAIAWLKNNRKDIKKNNNNFEYKIKEAEYLIAADNISE